MGLEEIKIIVPVHFGWSCVCHLLLLLVLLFIMHVGLVMLMVLFFVVLLMLMLMLVLLFMFMFMHLSNLMLMLELIIWLVRILNRLRWYNDMRMLVLRMIWWMLVMHDVLSMGSRMLLL